MKKTIFTLSILICSLQLYGQNINGKYLYKKSIKTSNINFVVFEMTIENDTLYTFDEYVGMKSKYESYKNWKKVTKKGSIRQVKGANYLLTNWNSGNKLTAVEVKITKNKVIFYTYDVRNIKVKSFEMSKIIL